MPGACALVWLAVSAIAVFGAACGTSGAALLSPPTAAGAADPEWQAVSQLAPDYAARVREAERLVPAETSPDARAEQQRRVAFLRTAARAEAARIALVRNADAQEQRLAKALDQRAQLERQQRALEQTRAIEIAARQERALAQWAFSALARGSAPSAQERDRIWDFCLHRAQALLAAANALGAVGEPVTQAELQLTAARTAKLPERVNKALHALHAACVVLGSVRVQREAPSPAERGDLLARLQELAFVPSIAPDGLVLDLPGGFGDPAEPAARLRLLATILPAFPHGPVVVACRGTRGCAWVEPLRDRLGERVQLDAGAHALAAGKARVMLPAYGTGGVAQ